MNEKITDYLLRAFLRDVAKGEEHAAGLRDTTEVAEHFGIPTSRALSKLNALFEDGLVVGYKGRPCWWSISGRALQGVEIEPTRQLGNP